MFSMATNSGFKNEGRANKITLYQAATKLSTKLNHRHMLLIQSFNLVPILVVYDK